MTVIDIRPETFAQATPYDMERLDTMLARERAWHAETPRYMKSGDIEAARQRGELMTVHGSLNIQPGRRFTDLSHAYPALLRPETLAIRNEFGRRWRFAMQTAGIDRPDIRLAETSYTRSQAYQNRLVAQPGKLASPDSTHCTGYAVDFDNAGYFRWEGDRLISVGHPDREAAQQAFLSSLPENRRFECDYDYDERITDIARDVARSLHDIARINLVEEFQYTSNAVLHMAVPPHPRTML
ncbi:hypothetical protein KA047_03220 [Candidatus Saccharibacteria bacterium]|nr:hypothetical protein [Candidatus Saccharibacteria bacterium]